MAVESITPRYSLTNQQAVKTLLIGNGLRGINSSNGNFMRVNSDGTNIEYTTTNNDVTGSFSVTGSFILNGGDSNTTGPAVSNNLIVESNDNTTELAF